MTISQEQINIYRNVFKGRSDIYAYRREKYGKSGYSPAYDFNRYKFNIHKNNGGNLSNFEDKTLKPLTDSVIYSHLNGEKTIGIYPLLQDNKSYFLVADFDDDSWEKDSKNLITTCKKYKIPAYIEKSRSGNGAHVRIFFDSPITAVKSRSLFLKLIQESFGSENFIKGSSFDRIFPNQDYLSKKGFGNLIALPLQGECMKNGNSVFIDSESFIPYDDQRKFLGGIKKLTESEFYKLYNSLIENQDNNIIIYDRIHQNSNILHINIEDKIYLNKSEINQDLYKFLYNELNIINMEYIMKKKLGKSLYKVDKYFKCISENTQNIIIPKGFLSNLEQYCIDYHIKYKIDYIGLSHESIHYLSNISLYTHQFECISKAYDKDCGVIVAPPGSGKTIMALDLIVHKGKKSLIIVHRQQLFDQWIERIQTYLGINKKDIGTIKGGKIKIGDKITIGMLQTISKTEEAKIFSEFGTVIIDECHHIPAKTFRKGIGNFTAENMFGFTATPKRKNNDESLIFAYLGPIISEISGTDIKDKKINNEIIIKESDLFIPFNYKTDNLELLSKSIIFDTTRNNIIINDILTELKNGNKLLVLTERKDHIDILSLNLKQKCELVCLSGNDSISSRNLKMQQIKNGEFQVLLTTGQLLGEGLDIPNLDVLFLVYPFSFEGKLIQYIGRLQRGNTENKIYDYRDLKIQYLEKMYKKRLSYYHKLQKTSGYQININGNKNLF